MLVLTRKKSELIQIGEGIVIKIISCGAKSVRIGIEAPKDVRVLRGELCTDLNLAPLAQFFVDKTVRLNADHTVTPAKDAIPVAMNALPLARAS
jgi:carbon storage regulator CsrA